MVMKSIRATYSDGVLKPRERLELEDGVEVVLSISIAQFMDST